MQLCEDEVGHEEVAVVLEAGRLHLGTADEGGQLVVEARDHLAEQQRHFLGKDGIRGLLDELEETGLTLLHHVFNGVDVLLATV